MKFRKKLILKEVLDLLEEEDIDEPLNFLTFGPDEGNEATDIEDEDEEKVGPLDQYCKEKEIIANKKMEQKRVAEEPNRLYEEVLIYNACHMVVGVTVNQNYVDRVSNLLGVLSTVLRVSNIPFNTRTEIR
ncbi:unnamed protein product [Lepeophtheirus salmonis]|uniref:(salmon louse) hypothetical protein n=1 Tax=Lepeophtheirus salmonis TaxID=72036 RepID=A0A7R8HDA9_LEPSM|nr:unnamed protein product [Lepeophtheirus salmonis]CAF3006164.1 unnamed protein product [Lepeophtheirus salmonis]